MTDVFVSYTHEDRDRVEPIVRALEGLGWSVWWDPRGRAGADLQSMVVDELEGARVVLVVWSKRSVASQWVRDEARIGVNRKKLVPVAIDHVQPPLGFGEIKTANLENWTGNTESQDFRSVIEGVKFFAFAPTGDPNFLQRKGYNVGWNRLYRGVDRNKVFSIVNWDDSIMLLERKYGWAIGSYEFWEAGNYYLRISHPDVAAGGNVSISRVLDLDLLKERNPERWQDRVAFMAPLLVLDYSYCQLLEDESASVGGLLYRQQSNPLEFYAPFGEWAARLSRILQLLP